MKKETLTSALVVAVCICMVLANFGKPKPPLVDLVTAKQELPNVEEHLPGSSALGDRVSKSYGMALILVRSPYSESNGVALGSLRLWAAQHFQVEPGFLHPVVLEPTDLHTQTIVGSLSYNFGIYARYKLEELAGNFLKDQIARFHESRAYNSFRSAYFDFFGMDAESALLLAHYQSERAKSALDVLLWFGLFLVVTVAGVSAVVISKAGNRMKTLQHVIAYLWMLIGLSYLYTAFTQNLISVLVSSVVALVVGLYLRFPFVLTATGKDGFSLQFIELPSHWIALALWLSYSIFVIQVLTWIRIGNLINSDPLTLLLSSFTGDFIHDPVKGKKHVAQIIDVTWLLMSWWTVNQTTKDARNARDAKQKLSKLGGASLP